MHLTGLINVRNLLAEICLHRKNQTAFRAGCVVRWKCLSSLSAGSANYPTTNIPFEGAFQGLKMPFLGARGAISSVTVIKYTLRRKIPSCLGG